MKPAITKLMTNGLATLVAVASILGVAAAQAKPEAKKSELSVGVFDGQPVVLGGLIRADAPNRPGVLDKNLERLLHERNQLMQRLHEVEILIEKMTKE